MLNKVEDTLAATAPEHVVHQLLRHPGRLQVAQRRVVPMQDVGQSVLGRVEVITTTFAEKSRHESQSGAMQVLATWTSSSASASLSRRMTTTGAVTVEFITTMVKFSLVKRIFGVLKLDKESFLAYQKQWYGCSPEEAKAKWKSALASPHVHRERVDGLMQVAVKKPTKIIHKHTIGTEESTNAKTSNVDKMTAKQLFSDHSQSQTFGAESSGLGTAALARRCAVAASIGVCSDASDGDDGGLRSRPVKKRAAGADRACRALVLARP